MKKKKEFKFDRLSGNCTPDHDQTKINLPVKKQIISKREKDAHAGPDMKPHGHPQDMSFGPLSELMMDGYDRYIFHVGASHTDPANPCHDLDGAELSIEETLNQAEHGASLYTLTHCGCSGSFETFKSTDPEAEHRYVCAGGWGRDIPAPVE